MQLSVIGGLGFLLACSLLGGPAAAQDAGQPSGTGPSMTAAHSSPPCPAPAIDTAGWQRVTSQTFPVSLVAPAGFRLVPIPPGASARFELWALGPGGRTDPGDALITVERADSLEATLNGGPDGPMGGIVDEWASCDDTLGEQVVRYVSSRELVTGNAGKSVVVYHVAAAYERPVGGWIVVSGMAFAPEMQSRLLAALRTIRARPE